MREVVGLVGDTRGNLYQKDFQPTIYIPHLQQTKNWQGPSWGYRAMMAFVMRTSGDPDALVPAIRRAVAEVDSSKPAANIRTIESRIDRQMVGDKLFAILLSIFGTAAALLAAIGIYGVMAYAVEQRTREIGVRMALGASAPNVLGLVARQILILVLGGMIVGLAGAYGLTRFLMEMLWNVSPTDPVMFASVAVGLFVVSIVACLIPTRRAMKVDPAIALRYE
jgi:ABC-type antimicrobial peptide transport system permease subunit